MLTVRVGCNIHFECDSSATAILLVNPRFDPERPVRREDLDFGRAQRSESFTDADGNVAYRVILEIGPNQIRHDALVEVTALRQERSIRRRSVYRNTPVGIFALTFCPAAIAIQTSCSYSPGKSSDTSSTPASACRESRTGFTTISSIASVQAGRISQPRKSSREATVYAATSPIARLRYAAR